MMFMSELYSTYIRNARMSAPHGMEDIAVVKYEKSVTATS